MRAYTHVGLGTPIANLNIFDLEKTPKTSSCSWRVVVVASCCFGQFPDLQELCFRFLHALSGWENEDAAVENLRHVGHKPGFCNALNQGNNSSEVNFLLFGFKPLAGYGG